jgi:mevalonate kinase
LIPLLNRPLLINPEPAGITVVNPAKFLNSCTLFLIDSRTTGKTSNLVAGFLAQYREQAGFRQAVDGAFIPTVNGIIESVLTADFKAFDPLMARYSEFQLDRLPHLIPTGMRKYFVRGIETGEFFLKICGSGGGGFMLGFSRDRVKAENYFKENHLDYFIV